MRVPKIGGVVAAIVLLTSVVEAQNRPPSTRGHTATQLGGSFNADGQYEGGKWIDIHYGRPILRGRQGIFGSGDEFGQGLLLGAPIWRVGADQTTTFTTEADLMIGGQRLPAGEYTMFADLSNPTAWELIFTTWGVKDDFREDNPNALWGAYGYTPEKDVMRTTMQAMTVEFSADQLVIGFQDVTQQGGTMLMLWDNQLAIVSVELAN